MNEIPYLMRPQNVNDDGALNIVDEYKDPEQKTYIHSDTVDQRIALRDQYKNQVFRPGHNMPTMSIEELAEIEMEDALRRQAQDQ